MQLHELVSYECYKLVNFLLDDGSSRTKSFGAEAPTLSSSSTDGDVEFRSFEVKLSDKSSLS